MNSSRLQLLGQAGALLHLHGRTIAIDPYLTDSVAERYGHEFRRLFAPCLSPADLVPLDWILLTHAHEDHTDLETLKPVAGAVQGPRIMAPWESRDLLLSAGFPADRIVPASPSWTRLGAGVEVRAIPAAHTQLETNQHGEWRYVGYMVKWDGQLFYHAGDTIPHATILREVEAEGRPDWALLPVNERNYFRDARGIIGNMTVREAFQFADALGVRRLVPIHWDLFALNSVHPEEIRLLHRLCQARCELRLHNAGETIPLAE